MLLPLLINNLLGPAPPTVTSAFRPEESVYARARGGLARTQFTPTGADPQPDPPRLFRDKASKKG